MNTLLEPLHKGGPVLVAILGLSVVLYARCLGLVLHLFQARRRIARAAAGGPLAPGESRAWQTGLREMFDRRQAVLRAMIAAAPLFGLLGTVTGMVRTFDSLSAQAGQRSMESLAGGISEALTATQAGLGVAIPALLLVSFAHRQCQRCLHELVRLGCATEEKG